MLFGIAHERPGKDGIIDFLVVQRLASNVDGLKPLQLLRCRTLAHIDGQGIVENPSLYILRLIEEILELIRELASHILTDRERALLSVHHLVRTFGIVRAFHPVHAAQRIAV